MDCKSIRASSFTASPFFSRRLHSRYHDGSGGPVKSSQPPSQRSSGSAFPPTDVFLSLRCGVAYQSVDSSWIVWFDTCISLSWTLDLNNDCLVNVEVTAIRNAKCVGLADLVAWKKPDTQHSRTLKALAFSVEHCQIWNGVSWRKSLTKLFWCGL